MIGTFDTAVSDPLIIFTVTGHGMLQDLHMKRISFLPAFTCLVHILHLLSKHGSVLYILMHMYTLMLNISARLNAAVLKPAAVLDSCVDALLLWGLAPQSRVTIKSWACI